MVCYRIGGRYRIGDRERCVAVCCSVLQCVAVCCSVLRCVAVCCCVCWNVLLWSAAELAGDTVWVSANGVLQCVAVCSRVLQCVAVCSRVLQCVAECCSVAVHRVLQQNWREIMYRSNDVLQSCTMCWSVIVCCSMWQCGVMWCSVLQCVFACSRIGGFWCIDRHIEYKLLLCGMQGCLVKNIGLFFIESNTVVQCVFACSRYILYGDLYTNSTNSAAGKDTLYHRV